MTGRSIGGGEPPAAPAAHDHGNLQLLALCRAVEHRERIALKEIGRHGHRPRGHDAGVEILAGSSLGEAEPIVARAGRS
jgi:hypothetical protein